MQDVVYSYEEIKVRLIPVFQEYGVKKAILFGSYSKGTATIQSDVDIVVDSGLRGLKFVALLEAIRQALDEKEIDLLDTSHIEKGSIVEKEILETGVSIYEE